MSHPLFLTNPYTVTHSYTCRNRHTHTQTHTVLYLRHTIFHNHTHGATQDHILSHRDLSHSYTGTPEGTPLAPSRSLTVHLKPGPDLWLPRSARPNSPPVAAGSGNPPSDPRPTTSPPRMPRGAKRSRD